jgi:bacterioferritin (cytochrome b1)
MKQVIEQLETLLLGEYLQRDVYETYSYYLFGLSSPQFQAHLITHKQEEDLHITLLQRYLMGLGAEPLLRRHPVPKIETQLSDILLCNLKLEKQAVENYAKAIHSLEGSTNPQVTALRIDLENVLVQEQEHVHDLQQWLRSK